MATDFQNLENLSSSIRTALKNNSVADILKKDQTNYLAILVESDTTYI